jgi:general secretion pathway protein L
MGFDSLRRWWLREFYTSMPNALIGTGSRDPLPRIIVDLRDEQVSICLIGPSGEEESVESIPLQRYDRSFIDERLAKHRRGHRRQPPKLTLSIPVAVSRSLIIPRQARLQVSEIVRDDIERKTPLKESDLFVGYDLRPADHSKLELRYLALPHATLASHLASLGISPGEIDGLQGRIYGRPEPFVVRFGAEKRRSTAKSALALKGLLAATLIAAATGAGATLWRQQEQIVALESELHGIRTSARQAADAARPVESVARDVQAFRDLRAAPGTVAILEELARTLPLNTYLTEIEISGRDISITGFSAGAPDIVHLVNDSATLQDAALSNRLVFDRSKGKDQFSLRASLRKPRTPDEDPQ